MEKANLDPKTQKLQNPEIKKMETTHSKTHSGSLNPQSGKQKGKSKKQIDRLILQYLKTKGYNEAEESFKREVLSLTTDPSQISTDSETEYTTGSSSESDDNDAGGVKRAKSVGNFLGASNKESGDGNAFNSSLKSVDSESLVGKRGLIDQNSQNANKKKRKTKIKDIIIKELLEKAVEGSSVTHILDLFKKDKNNRANMYESNFSKLLAWIDSSLDVYKPDLFSVSYPIFVHCFLNLMKDGLTERGLEFFDRFKKHYVDMYNDQILKLETITLPHHIYENELSKSFISCRYSVNMSVSAIELLLIYLETNNLVLLINIINSNLNIGISSSSAKSSGQEDNQRNVGLTGFNLGNINDMNNKTLNLDQLPLDPQLKEEVDRFLKTDLQRSNQEDKQDVENSEISETQKLYDNFVKLKGVDSDFLPRLDVPLPPFKVSDVVKQIEKLKDLSKRARVDPNNLPSVSMFTLHNTDYSMSSTTISDNFELLAAGFSDSYIKIWNIKKDPIRRFTNQFNIATIEDDLDLARAKESTNNDFFRLVGHSGPVYGMDFSNDNSFLISGSEDKTVRLWSMDTLSNLVCYRGHNYPVWDVSFGPIGVYFASASHDRTARLWSCEHIYPLRIFAGHLSDVNTVQFHPNNKYIITGSDDKTVRLWDIQTGKCVRLFSGHSGSVTTVCISPDGKYAASASSAPVIKPSKKSEENKGTVFHNTLGTGTKTNGGDTGGLRTSASGTKIRTSQEPRAFSSEIAESNVIKVWDLGSGKQLLNLYGHTETINTLSFNNESTILLSGSSDQSVKAWNVTQVGEKGGNEGSARTTIIPKSNQSLQGTSNGGMEGKRDKFGVWKKDMIKESKELLKSWGTVSTPIFKIKFTTRNLAGAIGAYTPPEV
ncbi:hypothetical protein BB558_001793 [Smittium angustum]|uniref:TFIID subunit TAF5 NTD2 domain-containing protein n=1 Tax=Smittium angustum TaxID=133377 RepID=A0A2U1JAL7_SMIAN|nr:hypothetical protein BB558_001793 [Smittium angustum]